MQGQRRLAGTDRYEVGAVGEDVDRVGRWADVAPIAADGVLLHIGPFKTGTTAIQESLAASRATLAAHGVTYPGTQRQHSHAAMSAIGTTFGWSGKGGAKAPKDDWRRLAAEVRATPGRVVISSEYFCLAKPRHVRAICEDLGQERVEVLVTLRPLDRLLPSTWQQYVKSGRSFGYEDWLRAVLADPPDPAVTPSFWMRNDHPALARRWAEVVGAERVTVLVLDDADRSMLYEVFERLLALPRDALTRQEKLRGNRSLSAVEVELLRAVNEEVARHDVRWRSYVEVVRNGAVRRLIDSRDPAPDEARIATPGWALDRATTIGRAAADELGRCGVRVIGDLDRLAERLPDSPVQPVADVLPVSVSVDLLLGALSGSMRRGPRFGKVGEAWPPVPQERGLASVSTRELVGTVGSRARERVRVGARGVARRGLRLLTRR